MLKEELRVALPAWTTYKEESRSRYIGRREEQSGVVSGVFIKWRMEIVDRGGFIVRVPPR